MRSQGYTLFARTSPGGATEAGNPRRDPANPSYFYFTTRGEAATVRPGVISPTRQQVPDQFANRFATRSDPLSKYRSQIACTASFPRTARRDAYADARVVAARALYPVIPLAAEASEPHTASKLIKRKLSSEKTKIAKRRATPRPQKTGLSMPSSQRH
jgi:hypothetical protein